MGTSIKLNMNKNGKNVNITKYQSMIGSLLYLTASKLDIMFCVCLCACFQACLKITCKCCKTYFFLFAWYGRFRVMVSERKRVKLYHIFKYILCQMQG